MPGHRELIDAKWALLAPLMPTDAPKSKRGADHLRGIIFCVFLVAAIITPAEPISMLALAVPLVLLFELAELFAFLNDRRKRRDDPYADLDDDEISRLDETPSPLDGPDVGEESGKRT